MRKLLASVGFLTLLVSTVVVASIVGSVLSDNWTWFQRSGAAVAFLGAVTAGRAFVRLGKAGASAGAPVVEKVTITGSAPDGRMRYKRDPKNVRLEREAKEDARAAFRGFVFGLIATLIGGYGDLLGLVF